MPFMPPVSIPRSVSGLPGKESVSSASSVNRLSREERGGSVKERITINLKNMGKTEQRGSGGAGKGGAEDRRRGKTKGTKPADNASTRGPAVPTAAPSQGSVKAVRSRLEGQPDGEEEEEAHFTLTLTPEAVLLLQRRSTQRPPRSGCGGATEARPSGWQKRPPPAQSRRSPKSGGEEPETDLRSILKISLLNDRHKYDDVEYEEEQYGLDQRVALKCTEWLRGLESPLTGAGTTVGGVGAWKGSVKNC